MLCFHLDNNEADSSDLLNKVFTNCLQELHLNSDDISDIGSRTSAREVQLVIMRFLSVLMSRSKSSAKSSSPVRFETFFCVLRLKTVVFVTLNNLLVPYITFYDSL